MSLRGKTLFITGASRGIGLAIGLKAARDGANVAIAAKTTDPEDLAAWRDTLARFRDEAAGRGTEWAIEVAFTEALLAVLDDRAAALPSDNPYHPYLRLVLDALGKQEER